MSVLPQSPPAVPADASERQYLVVRLPDGRRTEHVLRAGRVMIGRLPEAALRIDADAVSRRHAELYCDPFGRWWVRDLGSRNGTKVNGTRIQEAVLRPGDVIHIGNVRIELRNEAGRAAMAAMPGPVLPLADESDLSVSTLDVLESPAVGAAHLSRLLDIGQELAETEDARSRAQLICQLMVGLEFNAVSAVLLRLGLQASSAPVVLYPAATSSASVQPYVSRTVLQSVLISGKPVLGTNAAGMSGNVALSIAPGTQMLAAMACPVRSDETSMDVLYVNLPPQFGTAEWLTMTALIARQYREAENLWAVRQRIERQAAIEQDLRQAQQIQQRLLPRQLDLPGLELEIRFDACRWVAGDYVDAVPMPDGRVLVAVADVCGKGLQAALVMACLHTLVHSGVSAGGDLPCIMRGIEAYLRAYLPSGSFVTMLAAAIDPASGATECINAGHPAALLIGPDGGHTQTQSGMNFPLGVAEQEFSAEQLTLAPGQVLAIFTDGWTDLSDAQGDLLGSQRLAELLGASVAASAGQGLSQIVAHLEESARGSWSGGSVNDDRTLLIIRRR